MYTRKRTYTLHLGNNGAVYRIQIYRRGEEAVVVMTEVPENRGKTVADAAETIATAVAVMDRLDPATTVWIEHDPRRGKESEIYNLVTFTWDNCPPSPAGPGYDGWTNPVATNPAWQRLHPEVVYGLTVGWLWVDELVEAA